MESEDATEWGMSPVEFSQHFSYYYRITPPNTPLSGARAREFFLQTKLPPQTLSQIWLLADVNQDGCLSVDEFCLAMHLIRQCLRGFPLPPTLPAPLLTTHKLANNPQLPVADENHVERCREAFTAFHLHSGLLGGDAVKYLMMKSNLSDGQLFHIWRLSDMDQDGYLTFTEFTVAMHLIFIAKLDFILPVDLDIYTILPAYFFQVLKEVEDETKALSDEAEMTSDPFTPPTTPLGFTETHDVPENPFLTDAFVNLSGKKFRDGEYDEFLGDPFLTLDPFAGDGTANLFSSHSATKHTFVESDVPPFANDSASSTPQQPSPPSQASPPSQPSQRTTPLYHSPASQGSPASLRSSSSSSSHRSPLIERTSLDLSEGKPSPASVRSGGTPSSFKHSVSPQESPPTSVRSTSSNQSSPSHRFSFPVETQPSPLLRHQLYVAPPSPPSPPPPPSPPSPRSQRSFSSRDSAFSTTSTPSQSSPLPPTLSSPLRSRNYREDIVMERTEPILQVAKAVDVMDSREETPAFDGANEGGHSSEEEEEEGDIEPVPPTNGGQYWSEPPTESHEVFSARFSAELEDLSKASRRFLEQSQGGLEEQQDYHLGSTKTFDMTDFKAASMKGLSSAIEEMLGGNGLPTEEEEEQEDDLYQAQLAPVVEEKGEEGGGGIPGDVLMHLDDLEAEIQSALNDVNGELDLESDSAVVEPDYGIRSRAGGHVKPSYGTKHEEDKRQPRPPLSISMATRHEKPVSHEEVVLRRNKRSSLRASLERRRSLIQEEMMEDLDSYLEGELASMNELFQQFESKDKQSEQRNITEKEELETMEPKAIEDSRRIQLPHVSMEEMMRKKERESKQVQEEWEREWKQLEEQRLKEKEEEAIVTEMTSESDSALQNLEQEWASLLQVEEQRLEETEKMKVIRLAKEEEERKEAAKKAKEQEEMTVEEWIDWMEQKKKVGMTPEQLAEHERRKAAWRKQERAKEERRRREEEEKRQKMREMMAADEQAYRERTKEVKEMHHSSEEERRERLQELAQQEAEEKAQREERNRQRKEQMKQQAEEENTSHARSALAARWEERVRARSTSTRDKDHTSTVLSGGRVPSQSLVKEEQRMQRRLSGGAIGAAVVVGGGGVNGDLASREKRKSLDNI